MFNLFNKEKVISGDIIVNTKDYTEYMWMVTEVGNALQEGYAKSTIKPYTSKEFRVNGSDNTAKIGFKTTEKALENIDKKYVVGFSIIVR